MILLAAQVTVKLLAQSLKRTYEVFRAGLKFSAEFGLRIKPVTPLTLQ